MGLFDRQIFNAATDNPQDIVLTKGVYTFRFKGHAFINNLPKVLRFPVETNLAGKRALLRDVKIFEGFTDLEVAILENPGPLLLPIILGGVIAVALSVGFIVTSDNLVAIFDKTLNPAVLVAALLGIWMITRRR